MHLKFLISLIAMPLMLACSAVETNASEISRDRGISVQPRSQHITDPKQNYSASYALVIGIDNYTNGWPKLQNAIKDAELIATEMGRRGFKVTLRKNPNSKQLKQSLEHFYATKGADPDARLFVWYAGHGHTLKGEGYLVPSDAPVPDWAQRNIVDFKLKRRFGE